MRSHMHIYYLEHPRFTVYERLHSRNKNLGININKKGKLKVEKKRRRGGQFILNMQHDLFATYKTGQYMASGKPNVAKQKSSCCLKKEEKLKGEGSTF